MDDREQVYREALELHRLFRGKVSVECRVPLETAHDLALAYTPGVAEPCRRIAEDPDQVWMLTNRWNTVAVVSDGSAVLGLGDIGPEAGLPVMEGKCNLFKRFAAIDAYPLVLKSRDVDEIVSVVAALAPSLGGINLEDIAAPRCFAIEKALQERLDIPVFHDDQHGTAVIVLAGLMNALRLVGKSLEEARIVVNGIGAAGTAISRILLARGARHLLCCDRFGLMCDDDERLSGPQRDLAAATNPRRREGSLKEALVGADVFIGVSRPGLVTAEMIRSMADGAILFALANPVPEVFPDEALEAGAAVVATGRSDYPNQVNNCLGFPGIFRGALDAGARRVTEGMKLAAAEALAALVPEAELARDRILPSALDEGIVPAMAEAVARQARLEGICRQEHA
ncbi:MAG: NADP-dependent malic enzyme [Synergistaceae bacterium]|nr:NADP-dependent malic enzyme [Synergistaceae bacterium]